MGCAKIIICTRKRSPEIRGPRSFGGKGQPIHKALRVRGDRQNHKKKKITNTGMKGKDASRLEEHEKKETFGF